MADEILSCVKYLNQDGSVRLYVIQFSFDGVSYPDNWGEVTIMAEELQDAADLNEVKTLALARGKAIKDLCATAVVINDLIGPVSL